MAVPTHAANQAGTNAGINASQAIIVPYLLNTPPALTLGYTQPGQNADASAVLCPPLKPVVAGLAAHST
jgi:hypothetical protein